MNLCQHDECAQQTEHIFEKKDACYTKVKSRYDVWPSAYASGALVKCRKVGAKNWGNKSKKEGVNEKKGDFLDSLFPKAKVDKAVKIAKSMSGNMTGAVKKIEKMFKGMSKHTKVKDALRLANESVNEAKNLRDLNNSTAKNFASWKSDVLKLSKKLSNTEKSKVHKDITTLNKLVYNISKTFEKNLDESVNENKCLCEACWKGYEKKGMKKMFGKMYPNCVKKEGIQTTTWVGEGEIYWENNIGESGGYTFEYDNKDLNEAEYQGRKVKLGKPMQGDAKKFKVYVKNPKGNTVKVNFGQGGDAKGGTMKIRKSNPGARKSFRARHNCDTPGPRHKARYWSCRKW